MFYPKADRQYKPAQTNFFAPLNEKDDKEW